MTTKAILSNLRLIAVGICILIRPASAQVTWSSTSGSAWLTGANWTGGLVPGATQVAQFNSTPTSGTTGVGINMDTAGGSYSVGAIYVSALRTANLIIGNSAIATPGQLVLTGATISGTSNVILANLASSSARLTIQNTQGTGGSTMIINAGTTSKTIISGAGTTTTAGNTITLAVPVSGTGGLQFLGSGTWNSTTSTGNNGGILRLARSNTFTGGITVGIADGTQSGILYLDTLSAISNSSSNSITINKNSQLVLSAANGSTYPATAYTLSLAGNGNNASTSGAGAFYGSGNNAYIWDGAIDLAEDAGINVTGSGTLTATSTITGAGAMTKLGTGTLSLLGNNNSWTGGTVLKAGKITVVSGSGISQGNLDMSQTNGNQSITFNNAAQQIGNLSTSFVSTSASNSIILSGTRLTINQTADANFGGGISTQTSTITGTGSIEKKGAGRLTMTSAANTFSGGLKISGGEIRFNPLSGSSVSNPSADTLNGGDLSTVNISRSFTFNLGTLALTDNSSIYLGSDTTNSIKFANSNTINWTTGKILYIYNWRGNWTATAGTKGRVYIGTNATGITASQLAQVRFVDDSGYQYNATQLSTGELVPIGPTITLTAGAYGPFCNNIDNVLSVPFLFTGTLTGPFKVQLSNASGVFPSDYTSNIIGSGTASPIAATIPLGTTAGTGYRIRVINQFPVGTVSNNNGSNIIITGTPVLAAITGASATPAGTSVYWSNSTTGGTWTTANPLIATVNSTSGTVTGVNTGSTNITYTYTNFCGLSSYVTSPITVLPIPSITGFSPVSGIPGTTVVITGSNFNPTASANVVSFGNIKATVTSVSATTITVTVPANAQFDKISVVNTTTGQQAQSNYPFLPLYTNTGLMNDTANFKDPVTFTSGALPIGVALGDLDGDGKPDMVVSNSGPNNIYVYRNTSATGSINAGSFAAPQSFSTKVGPYYMKMADLTGDGLPEIIVACNGATSGGVCVFINASTPGSISFSARTDIASMINATDVAVADFDKDGRPDIAATTSTFAPLYIIRNTTVNGAFSYATTNFNTSSGISAAPVPFKLVATDLNNDNRPDIALTHYNLGTVSVMKNNSSPATGMDFSVGTTLTTGSNPTGIISADLDGDGAPDLAVTNVGNNTLSMFRNTGSAGSLSFSTATTLTSGPLPEDLATADVNADGKPDITIGNYAASTVSVYRNTATTGSLTASSLSLPTNLYTGPNPAAIAWSDIDSDGKPDLAVVSGSSSSVRLFKNYPLPPAGTITGNDSICVGITTTLNNAVAGGRWISTNTSIATINPTSGALYGVAPGVDTIAYYTVAQNDTNFAYFEVTVGSVTPVDAISMTTNTICEGASAIAANSAAGGTWASSNAAVATVDAFGLVTATGIGTAIISYTTLSFCGISSDTAVINVTPGTGYVMGSISGPAAVCHGSNITLTDTSSGGTWSSSNTAAATVDAGVVTGLSAGSSIISYSINSACGIYLATRNVAVDTTPDATVIAGPANICEGVPATYTNAAGIGGVWSTATGNANINSAGIASGISAGIDTIRYAFTNSCGSSAGYKEIVVTAQPDAGFISGPAIVCLSATVPFFGSIPGGTWLLANTNATLLGSGLVKGVTAGNDTLLYIMSNSCGADTATAALTVLAPPVAGTISGTTTLCVGASVTLRDTVSGGIWSSLNGNTSVADSVITGVNPGTDTIRYTVTNACGTAVAIKKVTINAITPVDTISGPSSVCTGAKITLTNATTGGTWSRTNSTASVSITGVVTGITPGIDTIKYTPSGTCPMVATKEVTVNASPAVGTIIASANVCVGDSIILRDTIASGTWSTTGHYSSVADSFMIGITPGTDTVKYTITTALCGSTSITKRITVNPLPYADEITGSNFVYVGETIILKDSTTGGTWSVKGENAIVTAGGRVGGLKEGADTVLYSVRNSCGTYTSIFPINVFPAGGAGTVNEIRLFPNPNNGAFTVKLISANTENVPVVISTADFKVISVMELTTNTEQPLNSELASGVYFLSVASKKGWFTTKFVIVN